MAEVPEKQKQQLCSEFLAARKILIADPTGASRSGLAKMLFTMGAKTNNLLIIDNFNEAVGIVKTQQPEVIVVDYGLGNNHGVQLSEETKSYRNKEEKLLILVTGNSSQSAVAQAAEEDVDVYILKPYTINGFTEILVRTVMAKMCPSDYIKTIRAGKKLLETNDLSGALVEFEKATSLSEKPTLAYYYKAQVELTQKLTGKAEASYNTGLAMDNLHYKCLTGSFDLLISQKRNVDAYGAVKKISSFFPANPKRLAQVLSLAVSTGNYPDVEQYYENFKAIETRNDELVRYVCASLVVCGRYYYKKKNTEKALEYLKKATVSAAGKTGILREVIATLIDNHALKEAEEVLKRFPPNPGKDPHYLVSNFLVQNSSEPEKAKLIPDLRAMVRDNIQEPLIWYWLIYHLVDFNKFDEADTVFEDAIKIWPAKEEYFLGALRIDEVEEDVPAT